MYEEWVKGGNNCRIVIVPCKQLDFFRCHHVTLSDLVNTPKVIQRVPSGEIQDPYRGQNTHRHHVIRGSRRQKERHQSGKCQSQWTPVDVRNNVIKVSLL